MLDCSAALEGALNEAEDEKTEIRMDRECARASKLLVRRGRANYTLGKSSQAQHIVV